MSDLVIASLAAPLQEKAREILRRAALLGIQTVVPHDGGARTDAQQIALYGKGRDFVRGQWVVVDRKRVVTWALPEDAPHCHRGAVDIWVLVRRRDDKKLRLATMDPKDGWTADETKEQAALWAELVAIGADLGLECGAHWPKRDYPHFELPNDEWRKLPRVG